MTLASFSILADENINPTLVNMLRNKGFDVAHVNDVGLGNTPDHVILAYTYDQKLSNWEKARKPETLSPIEPLN